MKTGSFLSTCNRRCNQYFKVGWLYCKKHVLITFFDHRIYFQKWTSLVGSMLIVYKTFASIASIIQNWPSKGLICLFLLQLKSSSMNFEIFKESVWKKGFKKIAKQFQRQKCVKTGMIIIWQSDYAWGYFLQGVRCHFTPLFGSGKEQKSLGVFILSFSSYTWVTCSHTDSGWELFLLLV